MICLQVTNLHEVQAGPFPDEGTDANGGTRRRTGEHMHDRGHKTRQEEDNGNIIQKACEEAKADRTRRRGGRTRSMRSSARRPKRWRHMRRQRRNRQRAARRIRGIQIDEQGRREHSGSVTNGESFTFDELTCMVFGGGGSGGSSTTRRKREDRLLLEGLDRLLSSIKAGGADKVDDEADDDGDMGDVDWPSTHTKEKT